jgi:hypothetical protein
MFTDTAVVVASNIKTHTEPGLLHWVAFVELLL